MTVMMLMRRSPLAAIGALMIVTVLASGILYISQMGRAGRQRSYVA